jgi:hypothetical protein
MKWIRLHTIIHGIEKVHYVRKFVCNLLQVGDFLRVLRFPPPKKTDRHDIAEIVLNVALKDTDCIGN